MKTSIGRIQQRGSNVSSGFLEQEKIKMSPRIIEIFIFCRLKKIPLLWKLMVVGINYFGKIHAICLLTDLYSNFTHNH
jgi:hypothetical protein